MGIRALHDANPALKKALPEIQESNVVTIHMARDSAQQIRTNQNELGGINFVLPSANSIGGITKALNVSRTNCIAVVTEYTRWAKVWPEVKEWLGLVAEKLAPNKPVVTIGLQYVDVFLWKADPRELRMSEILSETSRFLPKSAFSKPLLWHAHHGYFEDHTAPMPHRVLNNINVNIIENNQQRSIQILTSHKATFSSPVYSLADINSALDQLMPALHICNKQILDDILTQGVKDKIKLGTTGE